MTFNEIRQHTERIVDYVAGNKMLPVRGVSAPVLNSWKRSMDAHGIDPSKTEPVRILTENELREYIEPIEDFLRIAKVGVQYLHRQVSDLGYSTLLCDAHGVTVDWRGNERFSKQWKEAGLHLGAMWSESQEGTCGVGTALIEQIPLTVHRGEHFRAINSQLTCSCAPIIGPNGKTMGLIDVSALYSPESKESQHLALKLVMQSARIIEKSYFLHQFADQWVLRLNQDRELAEVASECLIAIDGNGKILAADWVACQILKNDAIAGQIVGSQIETIFELNFNQLLDITYRSNLIFPITTKERKLSLFASLRAPQAIFIQQSKNRQKKVSPHRKARSCPPFTLEHLAGSDVDLKKIVRKIKCVINKSIPILLTGETGTGKEVFAKAIHNASYRASKPFVAVNCAAIPESLIESELFGYKQGAFTGAGKQGMRGKLLQADGGTLFLDEIGDMPTRFQPRLLRALAEREVTPLGGENSIPVDLHVICATHRKIKDMVHTGEFREDLYYRLNGVSFALPPLRSRSDIKTLIYDVLRNEIAENMEDISIDDETLQALSEFHWPGNIRQLKNVLRYALAVCTDGVISLEDLPAEITSMPPPDIHPISFNQVRESHSLNITPRENRRLGNPETTSKWSSSEQQERQKILTLLQKHKWQVSNAVKEIGLSRATIYRKMDRYQIIPPNKR